MVIMLEFIYHYIATNLTLNVLLVINALVIIRWLYNYVEIKHAVILTRTHILFVVIGLFAWLFFDLYLYFSPPTDIIHAVAVSRLSRLILFTTMLGFGVTVVRK